MQTDRKPAVGPGSECPHQDLFEVNKSWVPPLLGKQAKLSTHTRTHTLPCCVHRSSMNGSSISRLSEGWSCRSTLHPKWANAGLGNPEKFQANRLQPVENFNEEICMCGFHLDAKGKFLQYSTRRPPRSGGAALAAASAQWARRSLTHTPRHPNRENISTSGETLQFHFATNFPKLWTYKIIFSDHFNAIWRCDEK